MDQEAPPSPMQIALDSSQTSPISQTVPDIFDVVFRTELDVARHHVTSSRHITFSLINKLYRTQHRLPSSLEFQEGEGNLMATRRWADDVLEAAWEVIAKAGRLVDDVDYLLPRLEEERAVPIEEVEGLKVNEQKMDRENHMDEPACQDDENHIL